MQVGGAISSLEDSKEGCVAGGVWFADAFTTCMFSWKLPRPLSPPINPDFRGIVLSCHVRPLPDLSRNYQGRALKLDPYCRCWFKVSETLAVRFGT